jgi:carbonic anhydrase
MGEAAIKTVDQLLLLNQKWAARKAGEDSDFFTRLAVAQNPHTLWIGCSDSRVSVDTITSTEPGEIFVHRNIANIVSSTDFNMLSVVEFSIEMLKINNIVICGHENCGGVKAALDGPDHSAFRFIAGWLKNIRDLYRLHRDEIDATNDNAGRVNRLAEISTIEQVNNLSQTYTIQKAWDSGCPLRIYGLMFSLKEGRLRQVFEKSAP